MDGFFLCFWKWEVALEIWNWEDGIGVYVYFWHKVLLAALCGIVCWQLILYQYHMWMTTSIILKIQQAGILFHYSFRLSLHRMNK